MDDEIHVVEQYPLGLLVALDADGPEAGFLAKSLLDFIRDGLNLPGVATAADDKKIGEGAGSLVQLEDRHFLGFFFLAGGDSVRDLTLEIVGFVHRASERGIRPP
jgi:hypothetical protein